MHDQQKRATNDADGRDVADEVEIELFIERRIDGGGGIEAETRRSRYCWRRPAGSR
jgi:hypothetical protein